MALLGVAAVFALALFSPWRASAGENFDRKESNSGAIYDIFWDSRLYSGVGGFPAAIEWFHNPAHKPSYVNQSEFESRVEAGFNAWEAVDDGLPQEPLIPVVNFAGSTTVSGANALDGVNVIEWDNGIAPAIALTPCWALTDPVTTEADPVTGETRLPVDAGAVTSIPFPGPAGVTYPRGALIDCGMAFNTDAIWSTSDTGQPFYYDVQSIATHEAGHFIGITHSTIAPDGELLQSIDSNTATMVAGGDSGNTLMRSLEQDDKSAILRTYARNATPILDQTLGGRGVIKLNLKKGSACETATGVSVWAYRTSEGPFGQNRVETFSGSDLRLGLGDEPVDGSVTLNVSPLPAGETYTIRAQTLEQGVGPFSAQRYNQTTINSNTLDNENQSRVFDGLAVVVSPVAGETIDLGDVGIANCWPDVSGSQIDIVAESATAPASAVIGGQMPVTSTFRNQGSQATGAFEAGIYFSTDAVIDADDRYAEFSCSVGSLAPDEAGSCDGAVTVPSLAPGSYYVGVLADRLNAVGESSESNNGFAAPTQVEVTSNPLDPIVNGSFETGDLSGWTVKELDTASNPNMQLKVDGAGVQFPTDCLQVDYYTCLDFFGSEPTDGQYAAMHDFNGDDPSTPPSSFVNRRELYQDVTLPTEAVTLLFDYRAAWELYRFGSTMDRTFSVEIEPAGGGTPLLAQTVLTALNGGYELDTQNPAGGGSYPPGAVDVSSFAGQDVRIKFVWNIPEPATGFGFFQLDNVRISTTPNVAPTVSISEPADGATYLEGDLINFAATASDAEDGDLTSAISWSSDLDGNLGAGAGGLSYLSVGTHTITAAVVDSSGAPGSDSITVEVATNTAPTVTISAPADGLTVEVGTSIDFAGTASDGEDDLNGDNLVWTSNLDGPIGAGTGFSISALSVGIHTITASVTDSGGLSGSDQVVVMVQPSGGATVLLSDGFSGSLANWTVVDEGTVEAPSNWFIDAGVLKQASNIYGGSTSGAILPKPGTYLLAGDGAWTDYTFTTKLRSTDNDGAGVMFRYQDSDNYYRFSMDAERKYRRLAKKEGGQFAVLFEDAVPFQTGQSYDIRTIVSGDAIRILIDGEIWTTVHDAGPESGRVALYSWGNNGLSFDDVSVIEGGEISEPPTVTILTPTDGAAVFAGSMLTMSASALDEEDGNLSTSVSWTSSIDGALGSGASLSSVLTAGVHRITASAIDSDGLAAIAEISLVVESTSAPTTLFSDDFSGTLASWTTVDEGSTEAPSNWFIDNGFLRQASNIYGGSTSASELPKPGTYALAGNTAWTDYTFTTRLNSTDNDGLGVMFRYQDSDNYYRFSMDAERGYRRLVKKVGGNFTLLAEDAFSFELGHTYEVRTVVAGDSTLIYIDGQLWKAVTDADLANGEIALYSWGNDGLSFDDVLVVSGAAVSAPPALTITSPIDGSTLYGGAVQLTGAATDLQDGDLSSSISWSSDVDGPLGSGGSVSATLSIGMHAITASVADSSGLTASQEVAVTVSEAGNGSVLFSDDFSGTLDAWTVTDEGKTSAPSNWFIDSGVLRQGSNIYGGSTSAAPLPKPGTYLSAGSAGWTDYTFSLRLKSTDDDGLGVMFRCQDGDNYYRFSMDSQRKYRRLVKKVGGTFTLLAQDGTGYQTNQWYDVVVAVSGSLISIYIDGELWNSISDSSLPNGRIALYSWGNDGLSFDDVSVESGGLVELPPSVTISSPADGATVAESVDLAGTATDSQGSDLTANLNWSSDIDGALGIGGTVSATLSPGVHTITATVTDSGGLTGSQSVVVTVGLLFSDDFSSTLANWAIIDEGTTSAPSKWAINNGVLGQTSNIYGGTLVAADLPKPGTFAVAGDSVWTDYTFSTRLKATDNDGMGVMFRYQDSDNYYRFSMDSERKFRRLVKKVGGTFTLLAEEPVGYKTNQWYDLQVVLSGTSISIYIDGQLWNTITDGDLSNGSIALYSWGNNGLYFDDVLVQ